MKKIAALILALITVFTLAACSGGGETKDIDIAAVKDKIVTDLAIDGAMDVDSSRLLDLYGIEAADIEQSACFITMDGVFPEEIIMIKATSADAAKKVADKLNNRIEEVKVQSESYDPENAALAKECKVIENGNYVAMFLSAKHADMEKIFEDAAK